MSLLTTIQADIAAIAADMGNPVMTWQDEDYACIAGGAGDSLILGDGGYEPVVAELALHISRALFTDDILPKAQQTLTFRGKTYRIGTVTLDPVTALVKLLLVSANRGINIR